MTKSGRGEMSKVQCNVYFDVSIVLIAFSSFSSSRRDTVDRSLDQPRIWR